MAETDRELLELAAKAAGYKCAWSDSRQGFYFGLGTYTPTVWNPLSYGGAALRLVVRLRMTLAHEPARGGWSVGAVVDGEFRWLAHDDNECRAITRAAAELARAADAGGKEG